MEGLASFIEGVIQGLKAIGDAVLSILDYLNPFSENFFVYKLISLLGDLLSYLFIPSQDALNGLVDSVKSKFAFIDTVKNTVIEIKDMLSNVDTVPTFKISISNNKYFNGDVLLLDLSWYSPYKPLGDLVISSFCYLLFIWRLFIKLPSIINGVSGSSTNSVNRESEGD